MSNLSDWQVLVIEDEDDSMEVVRGLLEHHGIQSVGVTTGEDALEAVKEFSPTLILVDLALPGVNGWELLEHFNGMPALRNVPRVAMTAYHTAELAEQAIEAGFSAYFPKPLDATSFVRELEVIVNG
jgi:CheY-like chemotaxis protein